MTTLVKVVVGVAVAAVVVSVVPALKGPYNRAKNNINEKLNAEFVVDNYKAEYVSLHEKLTNVDASIQKFTVEKRISQKKLEEAKQRLAAAKKHLVAAGTTNLTAFAALRDAYEMEKTSVQNNAAMVKTYDTAVKKLEQTRSVITSNMAKAKLNIETLSSKKVLLDTIKGVNENIANIKGTGDTELAVNVEKISDDLMREDIKLETLGDTAKPARVTKAEAEAYLSTLK